MTRINNYCNFDHVLKNLTKMKFGVHPKFDPIPCSTSVMTGCCRYNNSYCSICYIGNDFSRHITVFHFTNIVWVTSILVFFLKRHINVCIPQMILPTRIQNEFYTLIDNIFTNNVENSIKSKSRILINDI